MSTDQWRRIKEIFHSALAKKPDERERFLKEACGDDPRLRREVDALISSHEESGTFMELPSGAGLLDGSRDRTLSSTRIGQYLLKGVISSGGMGTVYEALQEKPRRTVAVKVMREGIASRSALHRFEYEAQILARLTHPNIARVIEAGTYRGKGGDDEEGMPYFVMEYIPDARAVNDYAREEKLALPERLNLFLQVLDAVHHGHQKGVIHRDLKPSNILVDGSGQVKIIDFGVARAIDSDLCVTTAHTDAGQLVGTVQYMSPEQCRADPDDIDIRSDVYALGVVFYELLCGELPYDVRNAAVFEAVRLVREAEPKKPSTADRALRGDVETIVLKALEKERRRRYQSVAEFGLDIRRYLTGEVILARPAGPVTRTWKRVKRNPVLGTAVGVALLAVFAFAGYILFVSYPEIKSQRDAAEAERKRAVAAEAKAVAALEEADRQRRAALAAGAEAKKEADTNKAVNAFLTEMLSSPHSLKDGPEVKVADVLDRASEKIGETLGDRPEIEAALRSTLGWTYNSLGLYEDAERNLRAAIEISRRIHGGENPATMYNRVHLGIILKNAGRHLEAESILRQAAGAYVRVKGEEDWDTLFAKSLLAKVLLNLERFSEAESIIRPVIEGQRRVHGDDHRNTLYSRSILAGIIQGQERYPEAEAMLRRLVEDSRRVLGEEDPEFLSYRHGLASVLSLERRDVEAELIFRKVIEDRRRILGEDDMDTIRSMGGLALLLARKGALLEADSLLRKVVEVSCRRLGEESLSVLDYRNNLAIVLANQDKTAEARKLFCEILEIRRRVQGETHSKTLGALTNLAQLAEREGDYPEAERLHREVLAIRRLLSGEEHPHTLQVKRGLAGTLKGKGAYAEAEGICLEVLEVSRRRLGADHPDTLGVMKLLANVLLLQGRYAEAEVIYQKGWKLAGKRLPENHLLITTFGADYGNCLRHLERFEESEKLLKEAVESFTGTLGEKNQRTQATVVALIRLYEAWGKPEKAEAWRKKLNRLK